MFLSQFGCSLHETSTTTNVTRSHARGKRACDEQHVSEDLLVCIKKQQPNRKKKYEYVCNQVCNQSDQVVSGLFKTFVIGLSFLKGE